MNKQMHF